MRRSLMMCIAHQIKKIGMEGECSTYGAEERWIWNFGAES
jgi:hypothetical protein